jgi:hypothetical protein
MKTERPISPAQKIAAVIALITLAGWIGYRIGAPEPDNRNQLALESPEAATEQKQQAAAREALRSRLMHDPKDEPPFWLSAIVPDPIRPRLPTPAIIPRGLGSPISAAEVSARVLALEATPASPANAARLNEQIILWFDLAPEQATEWLNQTARFGELGSSLTTIAENIAVSGHSEVALAWVDSISDDDARHSALMRIYAHQARQNRVNEATLKQMGFNEQDIAQILGGGLLD